jgi:hypothetical protein
LCVCGRRVKVRVDDGSRGIFWGPTDLRVDYEIASVCIPQVISVKAILLF